MCVCACRYLIINNIKFHFLSCKRKLLIETQDDDYHYDDLMDTIPISDIDNTAIESGKLSVQIVPGENSIDNFTLILTAEANLANLMDNFTHNTSLPPLPGTCYTI